jgi:hypothetical protein
LLDKYHEVRRHWRNARTVCRVPDKGKDRAP